ncbi:MAG: efflux RND transporter periplasmic adaptor subunit [Halothiobacillaceae bacterium]
MKKLPLQARTLTLLAIILPLLALFIYVILRSGPLAPNTVSVARVETRAITPALFGIGTVEARYTYKIGPTVAGRIKYLDVHVGDRVKAGQVLGEMEPIDLDERIRAQQAAQKAAEAAVKQAQAKATYAKTQARRYEQLLAARGTSEEMVATVRQEQAVADAALDAAREEVHRIRADLEALHAQRNNLQLIAPVEGLVVLRDADPGTTIVAGQAVIELIDPKSLWVNVRFDQIRASGLNGGLPARIVLRSRHDQPLKGRVLRVEPKADAVTEETLAKVNFDQPPEPLPPIGELAEVTVDLPTLAATPVIPNAAIVREGDKIGVWKIVDNSLQWTPITLGVSDLDGNVQVLEGLKDGERIVIYSEKALSAHSRIHIVEPARGAAP